jgi:hypothetical protein
LIQNWLEILSVLILILAGIIGAFWKLISKASENKSSYHTVINATQSVVLSRDVIPAIISLIEKVEHERDLNRGQGLEEILSHSQSSLSHYLQRVLQPLNPIKELEALYLRTIDYAFTCAYDMLGMAILPAITIIWLFVDTCWDYFIPLVLLTGLIILIKTVFDILRYTQTLRRFINKDNEIRLARIVS